MSSYTRKASGLMHSYHTLLPNCDNSGAHFAAKIRNPQAPGAGDPLADYVVTPAPEPAWWLCAGLPPAPGELTPPQSLPLAFQSVDDTKRMSASNWGLWRREPTRHQREPIKT
jgi:hypothetical protein